MSNYQKLTNGTRFFLRIVQMRLGKKYLPLTIIFNVTNRCNARCKHCYASYYNRNNKNEMTTKQVKRIIKDLKENGCLRISLLIMLKTKA
jgi:MoaA/NifB/PqqE/SkfB family radical SAM enzyme